MARSFYLWVAILLFAPLLYFGVDRWQFSQAAERTSGEVVQLHARNGDCRRRSVLLCTSFSADVTYVVGDRTYSTRIGAGKQAGYDQPLRFARYWLGERVAIAYDPRNPQNAYPDSQPEIWAVPVMVWVLQVAFFFGAFREGRR